MVIYWRCCVAGLTKRVNLFEKGSEPQWEYFKEDNNEMFCLKSKQTEQGSDVILQILTIYHVQTQIIGKMDYRYCHGPSNYRSEEFQHLPKSQSEMETTSGWGF